MLELMSPNLRAPAEAVKTKWDGFVPKIDARVNEVLVEADQGLDELISQHGLDPGPMGAAFSALQVRFRGLGQKLDEAWSKIDGELDQVRDKAQSAKDHEALGQLRAGMRASYGQAKDRIDLAYEGVQTRKNAQWARTLYTQAQRDSQQPVQCTKCGGGIQQTVFHQSSNVNCGHCGAVNQLHPGMAAGLFFQLIGLHALSHEQAYPEWLAMFRAEKAYHGFRVPITRDREALLAAAHAYWTKYYTAQRTMHPGFDETFGSIEKAVNAKLTHYGAWDPPIDQMTRAKFQVLVDTVATGDRNAIMRVLQGGATQPEMQRIVRIDANGMHEVMVKGFKTTYDLDDAVRCAYEHGDARGTMILLEIQHKQEGEDDPLPVWSGEQLARMSRDLRARS
jgi:hypothetical protein